MFSSMVISLLTLCAHSAQVPPPAAAACDAAPILVAQSQEQPAVRGGRAAPETRTEPEWIEPRVFVLKHARAHSIALIVERTCGVTAVSDDRTSSLIVSGFVNGLKCVEALVEKLDVPVAPMSESELTVVPLRYRTSQEVASALSQTFGSELRTVADHGRPLLMISGAAERVGRAKELVKSMDTPLPSVRIEATFFRAMPGRDQPADAIPADLEAVAAELSRFGGVGVMGRLSTAVAEAETFEVSGMISGDTSANAKIAGRILSMAGDSIKLEVSSKLEMDSARTEETPSGTKRIYLRPVFSLKTTLSLKPGEYIVLGTAPHGWKPGESAILVLKVDK